LISLEYCGHEQAVLERANVGHCLSDLGQGLGEKLCLCERSVNLYLQTKMVIGNCKKIGIATKK